MSLNQRIIISATLVLIIFITLTAITLERAFVASSETALRDTLTSQLFALMAAAEVENNQVIMPSNELDALLGLPGSGMYAFITEHTGQIIWQSSSALDANPPAPIFLPGGSKQFNQIKVNATTYYTFAYGVDWESDTSHIALTFNIATDLKAFNQQISQYRKTLWSWLIALAALLLISQTLILRWGLSPLRRVGTELNRIEQGKQTQIEQYYPREIEQLTRNINTLLKHENQQKVRYRNALGDLAHSLKTPLAVLQNSLANDSMDELPHEQIRRMNTIVEYQLQRAATAGSTTMGHAVNVKTVTSRILGSLKKVYRDKPLTINVAIDSELQFKGDEGDLMEVLGNLLDNAFKWTTDTIDITARQTGQLIAMTICDNGPGLSPEKIETLFERGIRADQNTPGHGIGLSIVKNIIDAYNGEIKIIKPESSGTCIHIVL